MVVHLVCVPVFMSMLAPARQLAEQAAKAFYCLNIGN
jgi:hypothetical protein